MSDQPAEEQAETPEERRARVQEHIDRIVTEERELLDRLAET